MKKRVFIIIGVLLVLLIGLFVYKKLLSKKGPDIKVEISNNLSLDLIKLVNRDYQDNWLISPYSIKVALNMLKEGAAGNTESQIAKILGKEKTNSIANKNIKIANAVFINNQVKKTVKNTFTDAIKNKYNGEVIYDDFKSPKVINDWVNEHTDKMIPKIMDSIDSYFVLGLANAIAIDVKWSHQFECELTKKEVFTKEDKSTINVQMMESSYESSDVSYFDNDNEIGIILPYQEETNLEFIALLPKKDLNNYLNNLTENDLTNIDKNKKNAGSKLHINVKLPRFKYDFDLDNFKKDLVELGMIDAFNSVKANFSKMFTEEKLKEANVYVDEAIHKTAIDLNETGTKAAAVTFFGLKDSAAIIPQDFETINIEFNKPFVYMIREKTTNEILFFGVANSPNKWEGSTCKGI